MSINFSKIKKSPFDIKSESSYNAYLSNGSLELGLKKTDFIAWVDIPQTEYQDHIIEARFRLDRLGGYAAAGIIFRIAGEDSYYLALVSSKGYFRLDVVQNNAPKTLIAWTEISEFYEASSEPASISLNIVTYGTYLIFIVNDRWVGEASDSSIASGRLGFAAASYSMDSEKEGENQESEDSYTCKAYLDYISVDTRFNVIEDEFKKWTDDSNINAECRLRLAETFAVMDEPVKAMDQINRAWKRRDEVIRTVSAATSAVRTRKEFLIAALMSFRLGQYKEAEEFIDAILEQWPDSAEGKLAYTEKLKILHELNEFAQLKEFVLEHPSKIDKDIGYYTLLARSYWELKEYKDCAKTWDKAFETFGENNAFAENGVYAANAGHAHELAGSKKAALKYFLSAGKIFLDQDNKAELEALAPKLSALGKKNWEARALTGKWAFSIEDYDKCVQEFSASDELRNALKPRPKADPALYYLLGLVHFIKGKNKTAIRFLEKAVKLAPDYELFRAKLEELKLLDAGTKPKSSAGKKSK